MDAKKIEMEQNQSRAPLYWHMTTFVVDHFMLI